MNHKKINVNKNNFNAIKNLNPNDLIIIKHKTRQGKVILRVLDNKIK